MTRKILVTNALPYANGDIHLGHLVGYIGADSFTRQRKEQRQGGSGRRGGGGGGGGFGGQGGGGGRRRGR